VRVTTIDELGNVHDTAGKFSEKPHSEPVGLQSTSSRAEEIAAARAVDERIAEAWDRYWAHEWHRLNSEARAAERDAQRHGYSSEIMARRRERAAVARQKADAAHAAAEQLAEDARELDRELYTGWNRFFLVEHIHSSMTCPSFRPTTQVRWLADVSGLTEAEAVAQHGATLCTICFPSAPTELTQPRVDPTVCPGSGQPADRTRPTGREDAYYSPSGTCAVCGQQLPLTARYSGKVRKHRTS